MGQIKSIVFHSRVDKPALNSEFSITKTSRGRLRVVYRNIILNLKTADFLTCASKLRTLDKELITNFNFSDTSFVEALAFFGVKAEFPGRTTFRLNREASNLYALRYRCLTVLLSEEEARVIEPYIATVPVVKRRRPFPSIFRILRRNGNHADRPMLCERLSVDLCENIHVHFQNLRFEFSKQEFLTLWDAVSAIKLSDLGSSRYGKLCSVTVPVDTEWDDRFQLEEQVEGHYHLHYRNLRLEFRDFTECGLIAPNDASYSIDQKFKTRYLDPSNLRLSGIRSERLSSLKAIVLTEAGLEFVPLEESPLYRSLSTNNRDLYDENTEIVKRHFPDNENDWMRFQELFTSIRTEGYQNASLIVTRGEGKHILDGQHRASILLHLHGPETVVKVAHYC